MEDQIKLALILLLLSRCGDGFTMDSLVAKANIYYQRPLRLGEPSEQMLSDVDELSSRNVFKVIVHGFTASRAHVSTRPLVHAYMGNGIENLLLADWQDIAALDYHSARKAVGKLVARFGKVLLDFIGKHEIERSAVHIVGHSLGAHIAGGIGNYFNGTLGRITGLDPALPLFTPGAPDSLHANAAMFVDVVHTDFPVFGDLTPRGTADFYPNFGYTPQRGCEEVDLITASKLVFEAYSCSHNRAVSLYAESIGMPKNFPTIPCSLKGIKLRNANICLQRLANNNLNRTSVIAAIANFDESQVVYMGESVSKSASGTFFLETYDAPPYGMGLNTAI